MLPNECINCEHIKKRKDLSSKINFLLSNELLEEEVCETLAEPNKQWTRLGGCAHRTHNKGIPIEKKGQPPIPKFIDPLKASRQAAKGLKQSSLKEMGVKSKKKKERRDGR